MLTVIKLISGAEIVGTVVKQHDDSLTVNNPLQIMYMQRSTGTPAITLQRYMPFTAQTDLTFSWAHIETTCKPLQGLTEYYTSSLKVIQEHIDPSLVTDLMDAAEPKKAHSYDSYLAMLEQHMSKKPLN